MNFLNIFENHVAGIFGAARAPFSFKKLAKQAAREMEDQTLVVNGVNTAPALYTVLIANEDDPLMAPYYPELTRELGEFVKAQAQRKRYNFVGDPLVRFMIDPSLRAGKFSVFAENVDAPTLARLYEEERAYQSGISQNVQAQTVNRQPEPEPEPLRPTPRPASRRGHASAMGARVPEVAIADGGLAAGAAGSPVADPFAPNIAEPVVSVPKTVSREALAGMGGAAATGAALGAAASIASNMANPRATSQPVAQLVDVVTGDVFEIRGPQCVIGRERASSDVALKDPNVSRRHAQVICAGGAWSIEDLNSTNGTLVNNRRVTRCPLRDGDLLTFGLSTFEFRG